MEVVKIRNSTCERRVREVSGSWVPLAARSATSLRYVYYILSRVGVVRIYALLVTLAVVYLCLRNACSPHPYMHLRYSDRVMSLNEWVQYEGEKRLYRLKVYLNGVESDSLPPVDSNKALMDSFMNRRLMGPHILTCLQLCSDKSRSTELPSSTPVIPRWHENIVPTYQEMSESVPPLRFSGAWSPVSANISSPACSDDSGVAIIFPFRGRGNQLRGTLSSLMPILRHQNICYRIFVVEQIGDGPFNKGILNNAGFLEAMRLFRFACVIFHDTDLVPMGEGASHACDTEVHTSPVHMGTGVSTFRYRLLYRTLVGGVIKFTANQFIHVNGYSNLFWGWGGEDDDMEARLTASTGYVHSSDSTARYEAIEHGQQTVTPFYNYRMTGLLHGNRERMPHDGLSNVHYRLASVDEETFFVRFKIDVGEVPYELDF